MKFLHPILIFTLLFSFAAQKATFAQNSAEVKKVVPPTVKKNPALIKAVIPAKSKIVLPANILLKKDTSAVVNDKLTTAKTEIIPLYTTNAGPIGEDVLMVTKTINFSKADYLFYLLVGMFLLLASVRAGFPKYFNDLFGLFSHSTFKQKSIREQLSQTAVRVAKETPLCTR